MKSCGDSGFAILLGHPREDQILSIRRPARRRIALAAGQTMRSFVAGGRHGPDRRVVALFFFIHGHANERDARAIGRNLRIADPNEIEQIFLGNVPLSGPDGGGKRDDDERQKEESFHARSICAFGVRWQAIRTSATNTAPNGRRKLAGGASHRLGRETILAPERGVAYRLTPARFPIVITNGTRSAHIKNDERSPGRGWSPFSR